jgi:hypothetical protein
MKIYFRLYLLITGLILVAIMGCTGGKVLTPEKVIDQQDKWLNKVITVRGVAGTLWMSCTEEACDPGLCCNACFASLALYTDLDSFDQAAGQGPYAYQGNGPAIGLEFPDWEGCKGNECEVSCEPLQLGEWYRVTGILRECSGSVPWCEMVVESYQQE